MSGEIDPISDDEILYRRVPVSLGWYSQDTGLLMSEAFRPDKKRDTTGLSVARAKFKTTEEAALGVPGKSYFVALLLAGELRAKGIAVVPQPNLPDGTFDPSHAELPDIKAATRKESITLIRQRVLAEELTHRVEGPFKTPETPV